jgi:hypothetical protein
VSSRFAEDYNLHQPFELRPRGFQSCNVNLMEEFYLNNDLAAVKTNASNTGRTDVLRKSDYFVNKCSGYFIGAMSTYIFG